MDRTWHQRYLSRRLGVVNPDYFQKDTRSFLLTFRCRSQKQPLQILPSNSGATFYRPQRTGHYAAENYALDPIDSRYLLIGDDEGLLSVHDTLQMVHTQQNCITPYKKKVFPLISHALSNKVKREPISTVQWYPQDSGILTTSSKCSPVLRVWDSNGLKMVDSFRFCPDHLLTSCVEHHHMSPKSTLIAVALQHNNDYSYENLVQNYTQFKETVKHAPRTMTGDVVLCDLRSGSSSHQLNASSGKTSKVVGYPCHVQWHPINKNHLATGFSDGNVLIWDIRSSNKYLTQLTESDSNTHRDSRDKAHQKYIVGLCYSHNGNNLISFDFDGRVKSWDCATHQSTPFMSNTMKYIKCLQLRWDAYPLRKIFLSPDDKFLYMFGGYFVAVFDLTNKGRCLFVEGTSGIIHGGVVDHSRQMMMGFPDYAYDGSVYHWNCVRRWGKVGDTTNLLTMRSEFNEPTISQRNKEYVQPFSNDRMTRCLKKVDAIMKLKTAGEKVDEMIKKKSAGEKVEGYDPERKFALKDIDSRRRKIEVNLPSSSSKANGSSDVTRGRTKIKYVNNVSRSSSSSNINDGASSSKSSTSTSVTDAGSLDSARKSSKKRSSLTKKRDSTSLSIAASDSRDSARKSSKERSSASKSRDSTSSNAAQNSITSGTIDSARKSSTSQNRNSISSSTSKSATVSGSMDSTRKSSKERSSPSKKHDRTSSSTVVSGRASSSGARKNSPLKRSSSHARVDDVTSNINKMPPKKRYKNWSSNGETSGINEKPSSTKDHGSSNTGYSSSCEDSTTNGVNVTETNSICAAQVELPVYVHETGVPDEWSSDDD